MPVVNCKEGPFDRFIGRPSKWGNPFFIGKDGTRGEVIAKYRLWLWQQILSGDITLNQLCELKDKRLGCYCAPLPCHGDILIKATTWASETRKLNSET
tara:strand:+ start:985 stop:1278 length:294 start_codon:yes stop_codon:yes gene_type:complete